MADMLVSVVMPVGAVDEELAAQLDALSVQETAFAVEVVLSLNTPAPAARAALDRLVAGMTGTNVVVVDSSAVRSASHARNAGVGAAGGEIVAFCDSDDVVQPGWLAKLVAGLDGADAVGGYLDDELLGGARPDWRPPTTPDALPTFLGVPYIVSANLAMSRSLFLEAGGFDGSLIRGEDVALSWTLVRMGRTLGYVADAVVAYRHRPSIRRMLRQHYLYGRGMSQILYRYGVPQAGDEWGSPRGLGMLRPNAARTRKRTVIGTMRRASILAGRLVGIVEEQLRTGSARIRRRDRTSDGDTERHSR